MVHATTLSNAPLILQQDDALEQRALDEIVARLTDRHWIAEIGASVRLNDTGISFELPVAQLEPLANVYRSLRRSIGCGVADLNTIRIRDYRKGNGHPPHCDHYEIHGEKLLFTALLYLTSPEAGGATRFTRAGSGAGKGGIDAEARPGRLVCWANYDAQGNEDARTEHESLTVTDGRKLVAIFLFYGPIACAGAVAEALDAARRASLAATETTHR